VHAILRRHGASRLNPTPPEPVVRYERERPGELLHIDVKRLGRIQRPRDPQTGRPYGAKGKAGWEYLFVCVDDNTRLAHCASYPQETTAAALDFLNDCRRFYQTLGIEIEEVLTDNGKCFQRTWKHSCRESGIKPLHTRIRRPQTNGKAERFIQTLLKEWIRPHIYETNQHRADALLEYLDHYNHRRRHRALDGLTPIQAVNNLPGTHTWFALQPGSRVSARVAQRGCDARDRAEERQLRRVVACPEGITRATVLEICAAEKIPCTETDLTLDDVYRADEVFCTGTMGELAGVTKIDNKIIGDGKVGPTTQRLSELYAQRTSKEGVQVVE
jgi:hypothetical protein